MSIDTNAADTINNLMDDDLAELDMDLDGLLEGVRPSADIQSPIPGTHVFIVRPHFSLRTRETEDGDVLQATFLYEILATESQLAQELVGGLLIETAKLGGAVPEYEKYSAAKQIEDGKRLLATRLVGFYSKLPTAVAGAKPSVMLAAIKEAYTDTGPTGIAARIRMTAKQKGEYTNIRSVKVLDGAFPLLMNDITGIFTEAELAEYPFFMPMEDDE